MSQGLRPHHHCWCEDNVKHYYDRDKGCLCKKATYKCTCGRKFYRIYESYYPPPKEKNKDKVLQKNKKKYNSK